MMPRILPRSPRCLVLVVTLLILANSASASDSIEQAGTVLEVLLPATAAGLTLGYKDGTGALQCRGLGVQSVAGG